MYVVMNLNPLIGYVNGRFSILGGLFYVRSKGTRADWSKHIQHAHVFDSETQAAMFMYNLYGMEYTNKYLCFVRLVKENREFIDTVTAES